MTVSFAFAFEPAFSALAIPGGESVYVASQNSEAVAVFDRNPTTGALTQKAGTAGCVSEDGTSGSPDYAPGACSDGRALDSAGSLAISPNGMNLYGAFAYSDAVAVFDRNVPPETTITSGPAGPTRDRSPSFGFTADEPGSSFECRIDNAPWEPRTSPYGAFALVESLHRFQVRATDTGGSTDPTPAERSFTVDITLAGSASAKKTQKQGGKRVQVKAKVKAGERSQRVRAARSRSGGRATSSAPRAARSPRAARRR